MVHIYYLYGVLVDGPITLLVPQTQTVEGLATSSWATGVHFEATVEYESDHHYVLTVFAK